MEKMAQKIPGAEYVLLPDCGHLGPHGPAGRRSMTPLLRLPRSARSLRSIPHALRPRLLSSVEGYRLNAKQARTARARRSSSGASASPRARRGTTARRAFPFENYADLREAGLLGLCVPEKLRRHGRGPA